MHPTGPHRYRKPLAPQGRPHMALRPHHHTAMPVQGPSTPSRHRLETGCAAQRFPQRAVGKLLLILFKSYEPTFGHEGVFYAVSGTPLTVKF